MAKSAVELKFKQIESLVDNLGQKEKMKLLKKLEKEAREQQWNALFARIDRRVKNNPISDDEILRICEDVRKRRYERTLKSSD